MRGFNVEQFCEAIDWNATTSKTDQVVVGALLLAARSGDEREVARAALLAELAGYAHRRLSAEGVEWEPGPAPKEHGSPPGQEGQRPTWEEVEGLFLGVLATERPELRERAKSAIRIARR